MLRKLRESRDQEGFTLIELLVVVIIIGILAAIAIPVFLNQRQKAYVKAAESDLRNAAIAVESYFVDNQAYPASTTWNTGPNALGNETVTVSSQVTVAYTNDADGTYTMTADHAATTAAPDATYDSAAGGLQ